MLPLRTRSTELLSVHGESVAGELVDGALSERAYMVELARLGQREPAYRAYLERALPTLQRYGYRLERALRVRGSSGLPFSPDLVRVSYFERADGAARMEQDPLHGELERSYGDSVEDALWIMGVAHP